jgi:hypothetical protein
MLSQFFTPFNQIEDQGAGVQGHHLYLKKLVGEKSWWGEKLLWEMIVVIKVGGEKSWWGKKLLGKKIWWRKKFGREKVHGKTVFLGRKKVIGKQVDGETS